MEKYNASYFRSKRPCCIEIPQKPPVKWTLIDKTSPNKVLKALFLLEKLEEKGSKTPEIKPRPFEDTTYENIYEAKDEYLSCKFSKFVKLYTAGSYKKKTQSHISDMRVFNENFDRQNFNKLSDLLDIYIISKEKKCELSIQQVNILEESQMNDSTINQFKNINRDICCIHSQPVVDFKLNEKISNFYIKRPQNPNDNNQYSDDCFSQPLNKILTFPLDKSDIEQKKTRIVTQNLISKITQKILPNEGPMVLYLPQWHNASFHINKLTILEGEKLDECIIIDLVSYNSGS